MGSVFQEAEFIAEDGGEFEIFGIDGGTESFFEFDALTGGELGDEGIAHAF